MDRLKRFLHPPPAYAPVDSDDTPEDSSSDDITSSQTLDPSSTPVSWLEYSIFLLLGVAMLWAWNMFLAAAPYFQSRFTTSPWILNHFQAAEISVSCVTSLGSMLVLSKLQKGASYPKRIASSLIINIIAFTILAFSTLISMSAGVYFGFLLVMIFIASLSTGLIQNGLFSFSTGFGRAEYTQAIMTGQAVAGVLPPLTQIISVAIASKNGGNLDAAAEDYKSAFIYFLTATAVSLIALLAFFYLLRRKNQTEAMRSAKYSNVHGTSEGDMVASANEHDHDKPNVGLWHLFQKLPYLATGVFLVFTVTMIGFPVFTASILSTRIPPISSAIFIPLAFLVWNLGDFFGRLLTLSPRLKLTHHPFALLCIAGVRLIFIPLYLLCNVKGRGALVTSDFFYLAIVQFLFGLSNGYVGSSCMMGAGEWVADDEKEAAGGFMGLMLVGGLTAGSLLSFGLGDI